MELKFELSKEQIDSLLKVEDWNNKQCLDMMQRCMARLRQLSGSVDVPKKEKPELPTYSFPKRTGKKWSNSDVELVRSDFLKFKGNMTPTRIKNLAKKLKRSDHAVVIQLTKLRPVFMKELLDSQAKVHADSAKGVKQPYSSSKATKHYKKIPKDHRSKESIESAKKMMGFLSKRGSELMKQGLTRKEAWKKASEEYKQNKGDAHTQQEKPSSESTGEPFQAKDSQQAKGFPMIYPLDRSAKNVFKDMLKTLVYSPEQEISKDMVESTLQLIEGFSWTEQVWRQFLEQVLYNNKAIVDYFDVKGKFITRQHYNSKVLKFSRG